MSAHRHHPAGSGHQFAAALHQLPPWAVPAVVVVGLFLLVAVVRKIRAGFAPQLDRQRLFTQAQRLRCFQRAGNRCEHKPLLGFRCREVPTQGDHIYPWSRGGATVMSNQAAMCRRHNAKKSNRIPSPLYVWRLERRRRSYFPLHEDPRVEWRIGVGR